MDKKLILIAEDEPAYAKILKTRLEKEGYAIVIVPNGEELLNLVRIEKSVLVVLDLIMPIKNGFEVLFEMKHDERLKMIPVLALSNLGQEEDIERAKRLGADDYLIKTDETFYDVIYRIKKLAN
ncbi:MAG TPA: response regulator [Candidatus Saccharimonadales bacterium]|nr:response regulator [Candidatus Saccharimonadales bacterium]